MRQNVNIEWEVGEGGGRRGGGGPEYVVRQNVNTKW